MGPNQQTKVEQGGKTSKKWLKVGLPVGLGALVLVVVLIIVLVGMNNKTSSKALERFSDATSNLNSKSSKLSTEITKISTYSGNASSDSSLESASSDFDGALTEFDDATKGLKSDRKDLKSAAENYSSALKGYKSGTIDLASDFAKVSAIEDKVDEIDFNSSAASDVTSYVAEVDRISGEYEKYKSELSALSLKTEDGKSYRDASVNLLGQINGYMSEMKVAVQERDVTALSDIASKVSSLERNNPAEDKKQAIEDKLSYNSEDRKKVQSSEDSVNDQIRKINGSR